MTKAKTITTNLTKFKKTKRPGCLNVLVFGDVHLGNNLTKAGEIIPGLMAMLPENKTTAELDLIVIEGDLFDEGLMYNSDQLALIQNWMVWLLRRCAKYDIILRVLEGTPSHDDKQSRNFIPLLEAMNLDIDFKYVQDMIVEEHPIIGTVLYVPDEWSTSPDHTYQSAVKLLQTYGLEQVDYAVMHGAFEYQLPPHVSEITHDSKKWQKLVHYAIFVGHIHQYSKVGKIVATGSFDRYTHGDETPKGHTLAKLSSEGLEVVFVKNLSAKKFITINCCNLSVEDTMALVKKKIDIPKGSFVRLLALETDNTSTSAKFLAAEYPDFIWSIKIEDDNKDKKEKASALLPSISLESRSITPSNIESIMLDYATRRYTGDMALDDEAIKRLKSTLGELCQAA